MVDAAGYRHWTDAELELLADRSLAAADVAAATGRTEMAVRAARSRRGICRTRWTAEEIGRPRGGRRDGQPSGIGGNQASSLTPPGMHQCLMPPPCFTLSAGACSLA